MQDRKLGRADHHPTERSFIYVKGTPKVARFALKNTSSRPADEQSPSLRRFGESRCQVLRDSLNVSDIRFAALLKPSWRFIQASIFQKLMGDKRSQPLESGYVSSVKAKLKAQTKCWYGSVLSAFAPALTSIFIWVLPLLVLMGSLTHFTPVTPAHAAINEQLNFQARLLNAAGGLVPDGNYNVQFHIYSGGDGDPTTADETLEWTGTHLNDNSDGVRVVNGYLSVQLGSSVSQVNTLADVDWNDSTLWLSINIGDTGSGSTCSNEANFNSNCGGDGEMDPFMRLTSVPYAFNANRLDNLDSTDFVQLGQGLQTDSSTNSSIAINKTGASGDILTLQDGGTTELLFNQDGDLTLGSASDNGTLTLFDGSSNTVTFSPAAHGQNTVLTIPDAGGASDTICLLNLNNCSGGATTTLQQAYNNDANGSDSIIALTTDDDSIIFRNPSSSGTDSGYILSLDQLNTGAVDALRINNAGTGDLLGLYDSGTKVASFADGGHLLANNVATGTTGNTESTPRVDVTDITLDADSFNVNDVIFFNNSGQDYFTRVTVDNADGTYTVSPAVSYDADITVTRYNIQNIGASSTDYTTLSNRFFQGYFLGGIVVGAGSTTLSDGILNSSGSLALQSNGYTAYLPPSDGTLTVTLGGGGGTGELNFSLTGTEQTWQVPVGVTQVTIKAAGGSGSGSSSTATGGTGAVVNAIIDVVPGETLYIYVGGDGAVTAGGYNGGGNGDVGSSLDGGGGGGASDIRRGGNTLADRILVAAGGGGGGGDSGQGPGGNGGDPLGYAGGSGGGGGTLVAGGAGAGVSESGDLGVGGDSLDSGGPHRGGGGGGGGLYGGGAGDSTNGTPGGGGGGSSLVPAGGTVVTGTEGNTGDGFINISWASSGTPGIIPVFGNNNVLLDSFISQDVDTITVDSLLQVTDTGTFAGGLVVEGGAVFNEQGAAVDFRVESDGETGIISVTGSTNSISIGSTVGAAATTINSGTGTIAIGTTAQARTINLGTGAAVVQTINIGGTGANVISIGNTQTGGSISLGAAMTTGTINIGGTGAQTGTITLGGGTGAQTINLATGGTGAKTVTVGSTASTSSLTLQSGTGAINLGTTAQARTINLGTAAAVQTVTLGSTNTTSSTLIQSGSGDITLTSGDQIILTGFNCTGANGGALTAVAGVLTCTDDDGGGSSEWTDTGTFLHPADLSGAEDVGIGGTTLGGADIILFATGAATFNEQGDAVDFRVESDNTTGIISVTGSTDTISLGSTVGAAATTINSGTGNIDIGTSASARTINLGTGAAVVQTINVGGTGANVISIGNTQTGGSISLGAAMTTGTINIGGTGAQTGTITLGGGSGAQAINLGAGGTAAKTVTLGSTASTSSTTINSGTGNIDIGTTAQARAINVGTAAAVQTVTLGSTNSTSTTTLQGGTGGVNVGTGGIANTVQIGNTTGAVTQTINVGTNGTASSTSNVTIGSTVAGTVAVQGPTTVTGRTSGSATALLISNSTSTGSPLVVRDNSTDVFTIADGGAVTQRVVTDVATAFEVQEAGGQAYLTVDTESATDVLKVAIGAGSDDVVFVLDAFDTDPSGTIPDGAMFYDADGDVFRCRVNGAWTNCAGGTGGATKMLRFIPEFGGGTVSADGSNNNGTLLADWVSGLSSGEGEKHNYYQWTTAQATAQDYNVVVQVQIPSDYVSMGAASTFNFWISDPDAGTTNAQVTWALYDQDETQCFSEAEDGASAGVWNEETPASLGSCSFAANDIITFVFNLKTTSGAGTLRLGEFRFSYTN